MTKVTMFTPCDSLDLNSTGEFCIDGVHLEGWNSYGPDHHYGGSSGWKVVGACDGTCQPNLELPSEVTAMIERFKKDGHLGRFVISEHDDDPGFGINAAEDEE